MYLPPPHLTARVRINSIDPAPTAREAWLGTRGRISSLSAQPHQSQTFRVVSAEAAWIMGSRFLRDLQGISCALIGLVLRRDYRGSVSLSPILDAQNVAGVWHRPGANARGRRVNFLARVHPSRLPLGE